MVWLRAGLFSGLLLLASCGRIGFDALGSGGDPRPVDPTELVRLWHRSFPAQGFATSYDLGAFDEELAVLTIPYDTTVEVDGVVQAVPPAGAATVVVAIDAAGQTRWSKRLDAGATCDLRGIAVTSTAIRIAGPARSNGPSTLSECDLGVAAVQQPILLEYDHAGQLVTRSSFGASGANGANGQTWFARPAGDTDVVVTGIYGDMLVADGITLPQAPVCCDSTFVARTGRTPWAHGIVNPADDVLPRFVDVSDAGVCVAGTFTGTVSAFGSTLVAQGGRDVWVARLDVATGAARFVHAIGAVTEDRIGGVSATEDGCTLSLSTSGPIPLRDGTELVTAGGLDAAILDIDAAGVADGVSIGSAGNEITAGIVAFGDTSFAALSVGGSLQIGTELVGSGPALAIVRRRGRDVNLVELITSPQTVEGALVRTGEGVGVIGGFGGEIASRLGVAATAPQAVFAARYRAR